jgi:hypothetical protein
MPNELRIDAAERDKVKKEGVRADASIRAERTHISDDTTLLEIKHKANGIISSRDCHQNEGCTGQRTMDVSV